jgi:ArsR family transcriptional regulator, arsenate/arsenite/antimonite-responsive transcriptional repressor
MTDEAIARMAKALGHPARVSILRMLSGRACACGDIVDGLPLAQSTVSEHLRVLKAAGWITGVIDGSRTCYALNPEAIGELRSVLGPLLERWECAPACSSELSCT